MRVRTIAAQQAVADAVLCAILAELVSHIAAWRVPVFALLF